MRGTYTLLVSSSAFTPTSGRSGYCTSVWALKVATLTPPALGLPRITPWLGLCSLCFGNVCPTSLKSILGGSQGLSLNLYHFVSVNI